jgi:hypothetical protein
MPQPSTLAYVADLVIRRVLADVHDKSTLLVALEEAYPFDESTDSRRIWYQALVRYALIEKAATSKPDAA